MSARPELTPLLQALGEQPLHAGPPSDDAAVTMLQQCLHVLQLQLAMAERTSARAVTDITVRLVAVQRRCDALQAEVDGSLRRLAHPDDPPLQQSMASATDDVREHILETLGQLQFQDVTRQMLDQVRHGLGELGEHCAALAGGTCRPDGPGTVEAMQALLARWEHHYVMGQQRIAHGHALSAAGSPATGDLPDDAAAPRIELF